MTQTERNQAFSQFAAGDAMDDTSRFNILAVEDDQHMASFIAQRLEGDGHSATVVRTARARSTAPATPTWI